MASQFYIELDENGNKLYHGALTSSETEEADKLLGFLMDELPRKVAELEEQYGNGALYKYHLGEELSKLLEKFSVPQRERMYFWNEITNFAPDKERTKTGKKNLHRNFYEQCFQFYQIDPEIIKKYSWNIWKEFLDRTTGHDDERLIPWMGKQEKGFQIKEWRSFEKALHLYVQKMDTTVLDDEEAEAVFDGIRLMAEKWNEHIKKFAKEHPRSVKIVGTAKGKWEKKFYSECFSRAKKSRVEMNEVLCDEVFHDIMYANMKS